MRWVLLVVALGYFLWDWGLYFIVLFYMIDILVDESIMHLKSYQITKHNYRNNTQKTWLLKGGLSTALLLVAVLLIHIAILFIFL